MRADAAVIAARYGRETRHIHPHGQRTSSDLLIASTGLPSARCSSTLGPATIDDRSAGGWPSEATLRSRTPAVTGVCARYHGPIRRLSPLQPRVIGPTRGACGRVSYAILRAMSPVRCKKAYVATALFCGSAVEIRGGESVSFVDASCGPMVPDSAGSAPPAASLTS